MEAEFLPLKETPLHKAAKNNFIKILFLYIDLLKKNPHLLQLEDALGQTAGHLAVLSGHIDFLTIFLPQIKIGASISNKTG